MQESDVIYVYGNLSAKDDIEADILLYTDDFHEINVSSDSGVGYKVYIPNKSSKNLLESKIEGFGWVQDTPRNDFEDVLGGGDDITRASITTNTTMQTLVSRTCLKPFTLTKYMVSFSGDAHLVEVKLNTGYIAEYIVDQLLIDYPPIIKVSEGDTIYINIKKLVGDDVTAIGYIYGEETDT